MLIIDNSAIIYAINKINENQFLAVLIILSLEKNISFKGGGVQARKFWKVDVELWAGGRAQDMYQQLEGGFGSINPMLPMRGLRAKIGPKTKI